MRRTLLSLLVLGVVACPTASCTDPGCVHASTHACDCLEGGHGVSFCIFGSWHDCKCVDVCGNGFCEVAAGETIENCPADCTPRCGNGVCEAGETAAGCTEDCSVFLTRQLDILLMVDNSPAMEPKQAWLVEHVADLTARLAAADPPLDLHVGIITSDLGAGQFTPPSCGTIGGDQGILQNTPKGTTCATAPLTNTSDRFLSYTPDGAGGWTANFEGTLEDAIACYAAVGTDGCNFEHQLASVKAALDGCENDADCKQRQNVGFFRQDACLAVIILTDEDDCSAPPNSTLFDPTQTTLSSQLGPLASYRCFEFGNLCDGTDPGRAAGSREDCVPGNKDSNTAHQLYATKDIADFMKALKPRAPRLVYVSVIAGPATPVSVALDVYSYPAVQPSCTGDIGSAAPATRLTEFVGFFDADRARFISLCDADTVGALDLIGGDLVQLLTPP